VTNQATLQTRTLRLLRDNDLHATPKPSRPTSHVAPGTSEIVWDPGSLWRVGSFTALARMLGM
jgi:hypothetical protein